MSKLMKSLLAPSMEAYITSADGQAGCLARLGIHLCHGLLLLHAAR